MSNDTDKTAARDALLARVERTIAVPWRRIDLSPADVRALLDMARTSLPITAFYAERDALRAEVKRLHGLVIGARNLIDPEKHKAWEDAAAKESVACDERIERLERAVVDATPLMEFLAHAAPGEPIAGDAPLCAAAWVKEHGQ